MVTAPVGGWHFAAKAGDIEDDIPTLVTVGKVQIALCRVGNEFFAIDNICTHEFACFTDGFIEADGIERPLHQARFHFPTGKAMSGHSIENLRTYDVKREGKNVFVRVNAH